MSRVNLNRTVVVLTAQRAAVPLVVKTRNEIEVGAQRLVPKGSHLSGSGKLQPGRPLRESIGSDLRVSTYTVFSQIGSQKRYAASQHQGSQAHIIRGKGKLLKFKWERGNLLMKRRGRRSRTYFYFEQVKHPGNKRPVRFLTTPLHLFGRLNGFKVTSVPVNRSRLP